MLAINTPSAVRSSEKTAGMGSGILVAMVRAALLIAGLALIGFGLWLLS
jgi:hypothetical protein